MCKSDREYPTESARVRAFVKRLNAPLMALGWFLYSQQGRAVMVVEGDFGPGGSGEMTAIKGWTSEDFERDGHKLPPGLEDDLAHYDPDYEVIVAVASQEESKYYYYDVTTNAPAAELWEDMLRHGAIKLKDFKLSKKTDAHKDTTAKEG